METPVTIKDNDGHHWLLGEVLGTGWSACVYDATSKEDPKLQAVVKMFIYKETAPDELNVYQIVLTKSRMDAYKVARGLTHLGFPEMYGHGSHMMKTADEVKNYQFIVMQKLFPLTRDVSIPGMCAHLVEAVTFFHSCGWIHNDICGLNIMVDEKENFYLVDFEKATCSVDEKARRADYLGAFWALSRADWWPDTRKKVRFVSPVQLYCITGESKAWGCIDFVDGAEENVVNIPDKTYAVEARIGLSKKEYIIYKKLQTRKLSFYLDIGCTSSNKLFLITPQYKQPFGGEYDRDISMELFAKLTASILAQLERLHKAGYCHNNIHLGNILYDAATSRFILDDFSHATRLQSTLSSFVGDPSYSGRDSYTLTSSPRNDLDSVAFCLLTVAGLTLPWTQVKDPKHIHKAKLKFLNDTDTLLNTLESTVRKRDLISEILNINKHTALDKLPNYKAIKKLTNYLLHKCEFLELCASHCKSPVKGACPSCWCLSQSKDTIILGLPDERSRAAIDIMRHTNYWA